MNIGLKSFERRSGDTRNYRPGSRRAVASAQYHQSPIVSTARSVCCSDATHVHNSQCRSVFRSTRHSAYSAVQLDASTASHTPARREYGNMARHVGD
eukprot:3194754-Rhodomonas_salina.3